MDLISTGVGLAGFGLRPTTMEGLAAESKLRGRGRDRRQVGGRNPRHRPAQNAADSRSGLLWMGVSLEQRLPWRTQTWNLLVELKGISQTLGKRSR